MVYARPITGATICCFMHNKELYNREINHVEQQTTSKKGFKREQVKILPLRQSDGNEKSQKPGQPLLLQQNRHVENPNKMEYKIEKKEEELLETAGTVYRLLMLTVDQGVNNGS